MLIDRVMAFRRREVVSGSRIGRADPPLNCVFKVTIAGLESLVGDDQSTPDIASFSAIDGIGLSVDTKKVLQGSSPIAYDIPHSVNFKDVTLESGITNRTTFIRLMKWVYGANIGSAALTTDVAGIQSGPVSVAAPRTIVRTSPKLDISIAVPLNALSANKMSAERSPASAQVNMFGIDYRRIGVVPRSESPDFRGKVVIILRRSFPKSLEFGRLDANSTEIWIHRMGLFYEGLDISVIEG